MDIRDKLIIALSISLFVLGFYTGAGYTKETIEPEIIEVVKTQVEIIRVPEPYVVTVEKEVIKPVYIDKPYYALLLVSPEASKEELERAYEAVRYGRWAHQFFADNPGQQTLLTGNTAFNIYWVENYDLFRELLDRAYGNKE